MIRSHRAAPDPLTFTSVDFPRPPPPDAHITVPMVEAGCFIPTPYLYTAYAQYRFYVSGPLVKSPGKKRGIGRMAFSRMTSRRGYSPPVGIPPRPFLSRRTNRYLKHPSKKRDMDEHPRLQTPMPCTLTKDTQMRGVRNPEQGRCVAYLTQALRPLYPAIWMADPPSPLVLERSSTTSAIGSPGLLHH